VGRRRRQVLFALRVGQRFTLADYDRCVGRPPLSLLHELQGFCQRALDPAFFWPDFFRAVHCTVPSPHQLERMLKEAILNSARKGYHTAQSYGTKPSASGAPAAPGAGRGGRKGNGHRGR
jgi:hypothetical protein